MTFAPESGDCPSWTAPNFSRAARGRCQHGDVSDFSSRNPRPAMASFSAHPSASRSQHRHHALWLTALLAWLFAGTALAADEALNWASLNGEQQYMLSRFAPHWAQLDLAARRALLARAEAHSLEAKNRAAAASVAKPNSKVTPSRSTARLRRSLSAAEAGLSAHSFRLRRVLRDLPGVSSNERRDLLARWTGLSTTERVQLVDRYMHNSDDGDELDLQQSLRDGKISNAELQRGLASGKLQASDVKAALSAGSISTTTLKNGVASHAIVAEDLDKAMHDGDIESSDLSNAIKYNRRPDGDTSTAP